MTDPLRGTLIGVLPEVDYWPLYRGRDELANAILAIFAKELRDEAADIEAAHEGEPRNNHRPVVKHLRYLADRFDPAGGDTVAEPAQPMEKIMSVRLPPTMAWVLGEYAASKGESVSDIIRKAIKKLLTDEGLTGI